MTEAAGMSMEEARIWEASKSIRDATNEMIDEPPPIRRTSEMLAQFVRHAPFESLAIAFLVGYLIARRR